jgi:putative restriction endonuclease
MNFYQWLIDNQGLSIATAKKYNLVIHNRIKEWLPSYEQPKDIIEFEVLKRDIESLEIYKERNRIGNNMYSSALKHYQVFLSQNSESKQQLVIHDNGYDTETESLIKVRLQQTKFRRRLFDVSPFCAVSGFKNSDFLIASHIKPWSKCTDIERVDPFNGFLLTPNFDRLFDAGFITFSTSGRIEVSPQLDDIDKKFFVIPNYLKIELDLSHHKYLDFHRKVIFRN